jgi:DNA excision repair protein ERCC-4
VTGFAPLQNKLKALQLRKVHLWPRFHVTVAEDLSQTDNNVIELYQPMTEAMEIIQQSLVQCMDMTLKELKRSNSSVHIFIETKVVTRDILLIQLLRLLD